MINSLVPESYGNHFKSVIFKVLNIVLGTHCEIGLR